MRTSSPATPRPRVIASTSDRRSRLKLRSERPTRRARADAALINQWLFEQTADRPDRSPRPEAA